MATDSLGRSLPLAEEVGPPRANKFVGVFYFLWLGQSGDLGPSISPGSSDKDPTAIRNPGARSGDRSFIRITGASRSLAIMSRTTKASCASTPRCWPMPMST